MTPAELVSVLRAAGLECRTKGAEVVVHTCTFCGNAKWNLELNAERGLLHCWACRAGGRLEVFLTRLTGQAYRIPVNQAPPPARAAPPPRAFAMDPVTAVPGALRYLARRGITAEVAWQYGLGVCSEVGHLLAGRVVIPLRDFWTGHVLGWAGRSFTAQRPKYVSTLPHRQVTGWVQRQGAPCVLVEGPLDGIAIHRAGCQAGVLSGTGAGDVLEFVARLPPETPVVVMLDGDASAQAARLFWTLRPVHRETVLSLLPAHIDPADLEPMILGEAIRAACARSGGASTYEGEGHVLPEPKESL